ncbi:MAG: hypothetical protein KatS3mg105_2970 [Gemmatales bacterium]|nr:MAG: hypothetical protein KatS3mg105_2970 [Gemmatales bacterium]
MKAEWYYARGNERFGPITKIELKKLALNGELKPDDLVSRAGASQWKRAAELHGLFAEAAPVAAREVAEEASVRKLALWQFLAIAAALLLIFAGAFVFFSIQYKERLAQQRKQRQTKSQEVTSDASPAGKEPGKTSQPATMPPPKTVEKTAEKTTIDGKTKPTSKTEAKSPSKTPPSKTDGKAKPDPS